VKEGLLYDLALQKRDTVLIVERQPAMLPRDFLLCGTRIIPRVPYLILFVLTFRSSEKQGFSSWAYETLRPERASMNVGSFLTVVLAAVCMALANLLMRAGVLKSPGPLSLTRAHLLAIVCQPLYLSGLLLVGVAGILWTRVLSTGTLTVSYPLFVSLTYILLILGSVIFFRETLTALKVTGLCLILVGILLLTRP
jgi:multidrug transporter EmrE-like cation transporter